MRTMGKYVTEGNKFRKYANHDAVTLKVSCAATGIVY